MGRDAYLTVKLNLANFLFLVEDDLYWQAYLNSGKIALISTMLCLVIGYPIRLRDRALVPAARATCCCCW